MKLVLDSRAAALSLLLVLFLSATASAQVRLQWKFPENAQWTSKSTTKTAQTLNINGLDIETSQNMSMRHATSTGKRAADGTIEVTSKFTALKSEVGLPFGAKLSYDSEKETEPEGTQFDFLLEVFGALAKMEFTATYDKESQLQKVVVDPKPFENLGENSAALLKDQIAPERLGKAIRQEMKSIPAKSLNVGDSWDSTQTMDLSGGQSLTITTQFTYDGPMTKNGKTLQKISVKATKVVYEQTEEAPLKVTESDLKIESSDSYLLFDEAMGQIVEQHTKHEITGDMKFEIAGNPSNGKLKLKIERSSSFD